MGTSACQVHGSKTVGCGDVGSGLPQGIRSLGASAKVKGGRVELTISGKVDADRWVTHGSGKVYHDRNEAFVFVGTEALKGKGGKSGCGAEDFSRSLQLPISAAKSPGETYKIHLTDKSGNILASTKVRLPANDDSAYCGVVRQNKYC